MPKTRSHWRLYGTKVGRRIPQMGDFLQGYLTQAFRYSGKRTSANACSTTFVNKGKKKGRGYYYVAPR